ncbi:MAG: diguanylate cyclase [Bacteroidetes bacterium GWF2_42_66]|nr:MAG: diguanylate cyclase [Bacteroidetes bacterium GWA2_42_15]OFY02451.1 MAG: diguanylate cyclase [Bacteroidetes bacterium GWE2_42_39]OFY41450.1 MAG: diguanylate cyclase [Bacteroidetes bacterium GWF2_42_66]HBL75340.1 diguanylate cyclase [Prolixibacteraceae bacterium]HCR91515.1 diguanylate cyclase [Prolixibacteraceae bacterium]
MANLETKYMGLSLKSPIVVASSGLTNTVEKIKELELAGAGAVVLKSLFEEQINAEVSHLINKNPQNLYPEAEDYIWNYTRNNSITKHIELVREAKKVVSIPVIASINCVSDKEWTAFAKDLEQAGADALELNLFILPTQRDRSSAEIEQLYIDVLTKIKKLVKIPVSIKIGFYFTNLASMADKLVGAGAQAVVMFNRFYEPDIDINNLEIVPSEVFSSPSDIRRSLRWVGILSAAVPNLQIAASTGIHDSEAVIKQILVGAQVTQLCSTLYINGAQQIAGILDDLKEFMKKWNFKTIDDFRGRLSYKNIPDPQLYERSQFMKYFSSKP